MGVKQLLSAENIKNLWHDPFNTLILSLIKLSPNNVHTIDDLVTSMKSNTSYTLVDCTEVVLGHDSNDKIYHVKDDTVSESAITDFAFNIINMFSICDSQIPWENMDMFAKNTSVIFPDKFLAEITKDNILPISSMLGNLVQNGNFVEYYKYIATKGIGGHLLRYNSNDTYEIDLTEMSKYSVRGSYARYGAKAIYDNKLNVIAIELGYTPKFYDYKLVICDTSAKIIIPYEGLTGSHYWNFAHNVFTSSLVTYVTIADHLMFTHMLGSDNLLYTYYKYSEKVGNTDSLAQFIKPFVYGSSVINTFATKILFGKKNILHRLFAFDYEGLNEFINDLHSNHKRIAKPDLFKINKTTGLTPFTRDIQKYWDIMSSFVNDFVSQLSEEQVSTFYHTIDNSIDMINPKVHYDTVSDFLTYNLVLVTAWHQYVGSMAPYTFNPYACRITVFRDDPFNVMCKKYESYHAMLVTAITSRQTFPKLMDVSGIYVDQFKGDWIKLLDMLNNQTFECDTLQAKDVECSVSF